jgi:tetratricopeptide (TPR) repeat protein
VTDTTQLPSEEEITKYYHEVYVPMVEGKLKVRPLDNIRHLVINELMKVRTERFDSDFVFARAKRRFKLMKSDLENALLDIEESKRDRYRTKSGREYLVTLLLKQEFFSQEAKATGYLRLPHVKKEINEWEELFLAKQFQHDFLDRDLGYSERELQHYYQKNRKNFVSDSGETKPFEVVRPEIARRMLFNEKKMENFYNLNAEQFMDQDTQVVPLEEVRDTVYRAFMKNQIEKRQEKTYRLLRKLLGVKIFKRDYAVDLPSNDKTLFEQAQEILSAEEENGRAVKMLLKIRYDFPKSEYGDDVCLALGQIYIAQNQYSQAVWEYRKLLRLYPQSEHNYKAQFMLGYIYSEYMKNFEKAKTAYRKVIEQYPQSDLADDAEFMLKYLGKDVLDIDFLKKEK